MMKITHTLILLFSMISLLSVSCKSLQQTSKYGFNEGFYKSRVFDKKTGKLYVVPEDDQIKIYKKKNLHSIDTSSVVKISFPPDQKPADFTQYLFHRKSIDIDLISILLKYRPAISTFPNQLNTSIFNEAFFLGLRTDIYQLKYTQRPIYTFKKNVRHYGFSFGVFAGLGTTQMNEFVTQNNISIEYDGFVNVEGIAAFIAVQNFTFGLDFGIDQLMDPNHKVWIYQQKSWVGLSVGLHLK